LPLPSRFIIFANSWTAVESDALRFVAIKTRFWEQNFRLVNKYIDTSVREFQFCMLFCVRVELREEPGWAC
jgi:hypothetical protein